MGDLRAISDQQSAISSHSHAFRGYAGNARKPAHAHDKRGHGTGVPYFKRYGFRQQKLMGGAGRQKRFLHQHTGARFLGAKPWGLAKKMPLDNGFCGYNRLGNGLEGWRVKCAKGRVFLGRKCFWENGLRSVFGLGVYVKTGAKVTFVEFGRVGRWFGCAQVEVGMGVGRGRG